MLWKLLTLLGVALAIWGLARRALGLTAARPAPPRQPGVDGRGADGRGAVADLARCPACGAWKAPDAPCACRTPPTP
ncbi:MAG: hypothetical protein CO163_06095 [Rhodobacterales bacterium CG_4_9_14_3_um_filter_71_31]|nr:MAG: hypothetical protein CO163_06095 [Rhodobacterales bacterium CG_4_9_14_3_um_filter_71_31]